MTTKMKRVIQERIEKISVTLQILSVGTQTSYYQGFEKTDARSLYLAYREGYGGLKKSLIVKSNG